MCRLFGFRSVFSSRVHSSLVSADNAIMRQSERHPDGWGVAYYVAGAPHLIKSSETAIQDSMFRKVSGVVTSETVLAHLRNATQGDLNILNTHPFQYGNWVFAHNGNIRNFPEVKEKLRERIAPILRQFILGDTDSETIFFLILSQLARRVELHRRDCNLHEAMIAVREALDEIYEITGGFCEVDEGDRTQTYLTFMLTNGVMMLAHQGGKPLYYSTHKSRCSVREECPHYAPCCEQERNSGFVSHLLMSSEPLEQGENVWRPMQPGEMVGVDWRMHFYRFYDV
jgi:glutamine amidotransferase